MESTEILAVQKRVSEKIKSLENDFIRAFTRKVSKKIAPSPFPITMFTISVLDYISSLEAGWNETNKRLKRNQTDRLVQFLVKGMNYDITASKVLVQINRHQLMHTSDPRLVRDKRTGNVYGWSISNNDSKNMQLIKQPSPLGMAEIFLLHFGLKQFIKDLKIYTKQYLEKLAKSPVLQNNYIRCMDEIKVKDMDLSR